MTNTDTLRAKELFFDALDLEGSAREAFLQELRAGRPALAERVDALLRAHEGAERTGIEPLAKGVLSEVARHTVPVEVGTVIGDYELLEEVAAGSSGVVWRARQRSLDRIVAIKLLRTGSFAGQAEIERFREEAEAVARLDHPHIVPVYEISEAAGQTFFSMKWIEGGSLADRVGERLSFASIARLMAKTARAVHHAHQRGLLHRDLKPSNVLLDPDGEPHVADFGIAKRIDATESGTGTAHFAGTPAYMAPEQAELDSELTVEVDVWALGCVLYELIAGQQAFRGGSLTEVLQRVRARPPEPLRKLRPDCPRDLETITLRCLAKSPEGRYPSANSFAEDLQRWLEFEPIDAKRPSLAKRGWLYWKRSPLVASLLLLLVTLTVAVAVGASTMSVALRSRLRDSLRDQAVATRLSGVVGRRASGLALLRQAASIRPGADLRDEAIATLALLDLEVESEGPRRDDQALVVFDGALERVFSRNAAGDVVVEPLGGGSALRVFECDPPARWLRLSGDGSYLLVKCYEKDNWYGDPHVYVFDVESGERLFDLAEPVAEVAFELSSDARLLAFGRPDGTVEVREVVSGEVVLRTEVDGNAAALTFDPSGEALAIANRADPDEGEEERVVVLRVGDGALVATRELPDHPYCLSWCAGGRALLYGMADYRAELWWPGGEQESVEFVGHDSDVVAAYASEELPFVTTYSWDETMRLWDAVTGEELLRVSARPMGMSHTGERIGFVTNQSIGVWRIEYGAVQRTLHGHEGKSPIGLAFSPTGARLVSVGGDGALLWDVASGRTLRRLQSTAVEDALFEGEDQLVLSGAGGVERLDLRGAGARELLLESAAKELDRTRDGERLVLRQGRSVRVADGGGFSPDDLVIHAETRVEQVFIAPDGGWVAAATWHGTGARVWDATTGEPITVLLPEIDTVTVAVSPLGDLLATGTDSDYRVWRTSDWSEVWRFERAIELTGGGGPLAFTPDGQSLAVLDTKERVAILDAATGVLRYQLEAPDPRTIGHLVFTEDGRTLAGACSSNHVQVWDLARLERELGELGLTGR